MLVREFMTSTLTCVQETDTLLDATMVFLHSSFRHLPVLRGKELVGMVTERDLKAHLPTLLTRVTPELYNQTLETTPVSKVMSRDIASVSPDQPMAEAAAMLLERRIGSLPVVENGDLVGIITTTDMLRLLARLLKSQESSSPA